MIRTTPPTRRYRDDDDDGDNRADDDDDFENVFLPFSWIESTFVDGFVGEPAIQIRFVRRIGVREEDSDNDDDGLRSRTSTKDCCSNPKGAFNQ